MKLKNVLMIILLALTMIPITIVSVLLYKSGFELSRESYTRNLVESLNVQADYISQVVEKNMIADYRFASQTVVTHSNSGDLYNEFASYLSAAEDKIAVCMLLDQNDNTIYSIGEKQMTDVVKEQIPKPTSLEEQTIQEFGWGDGSYSLGIITPVWNQDTYLGCLVSVYDRSYLFKVISSYYEIVDTSTYICRENGDVINSRNPFTKSGTEVTQLLHELDFDKEGKIDAASERSVPSGYYKNIHNTPWYLIGFVDDALIYSFTNQFLIVYIIIILIVLLVDVILAFYCSHRVVQPLNSLIEMMERYHNNLNDLNISTFEERGYYETNYLRSKFLELMRKISLAQHNFKGIYQLYESNDMGDTNIDIDVKAQTISSNKNVFQNLMSVVSVPKDACIVETFTHCFCEEDQKMLMEMFVKMRDEHLSSIKETEVYTPYLNGKWYHTMVVPMYENDRLARLFIQLRDVSSFKIQELAASEQAQRDALTGLYNRTGFTARIDKALVSGASFDLHGLFFIDMDYFKLVNDNFGHNAGDDLLRAIAKTLLDATRPEDIVSRFGGDEFVVFLPHTTEKAVSTVEQRLKERLVFPFHTDQISFVVSASVGVSYWKHDTPDTLEHLLQQADAAMYKAKRTFKANANQSGTEQ